MMELISIPGIGKNSYELLEAAGFHDVESLAQAGLDELMVELDRANTRLKLAERAPSKASVEKWISAARAASGLEENSANPPLMPVNYEATEQVSSLLVSAPFAVPLPARVLVENHVGVSEIPPAILLNRYSGDLDVRVESRLPKTKESKLANGAGATGTNHLRGEKHTALHIEINVSKIRAAEDAPQPFAAFHVAKETPVNERVALLRTPRDTTNKGRDPKSPWYIRGVLHSHPMSIYLGAAVTLFTAFLFPLAVASATLLFLSGENPENFSWVPKWLIALPIALPIFGLAYLMLGLSCSCRVCGQKLFVHRAHLKNSKAHHIPLLGYVIPLCFQILIFRWFRCTHCGTPIRVKE